MKFCRIQVLVEELLVKWDKLNLAAKILAYLDFLLSSNTKSSSEKIKISFISVNLVDISTK